MARLISLRSIASVLAHLGRDMSDDSVRTLGFAQIREHLPGADDRDILDALELYNRNEQALWGDAPLSIIASNREVMLFGQPRPLI